MSKNYYQLYIQSVMGLAQTLCIKSEESATAINKALVNVYGVGALDESDPTSWKYYMNVCGLYHPTDSVIYITSLDTQEIIPFTKASLAVNKATAKAYQFGTSYYNELVTLNPLAEQLILGVLYPADMATVVNAANNTIVSWAPAYVEPNEANLINKLQDWILKFRARWDNTAFSASDSLYCAAVHGIMYQNLVPAILNIRLHNCKTAYAHSFHVRQYLASHGFFDSYADSMTLEQSMWFYRNIAYVERNSGKTSTFAKLIAKALTLRSLPIAGYDMVLNTVDMPGSYKATPQFKKNPLNLINAIEIDEVVTLPRLLQKETPLATGNADYVSYESEAIQAQLENSLGSRLQTKVLESTVSQVSDGPGQQLANVLFNHWLLLSNSGLYNVYVRVNNPRTGEVITLSTKDAFTYAIYCYCYSIGINIANVPQCIAYASQDLTQPSVSDLTSLVDVAYIDARYPAGSKAADLAQLIIGWQPVVEQVTSTSVFHDLCVEIQEATAKQERLTSNQEDAYVRGMVEMMTLRMYSDTTIWPEGQNTTYAQWLATKSLPATAFSTKEYGDLYAQLVLVATGADLNKVESVSDLQAAMLSMLQQLSSYSIQLIADTLGTNVTALKWAQIRASNIQMDAHDRGHAEVTDTLAIDYRAQECEKDRINVDMDRWVHTETELSHSVEIYFDNGVTANHSVETTQRINFGTITINDNVVPNESGQNPNATLDDYYEAESFTTAQKATFVDLYGYPYYTGQPEAEEYLLYEGHQLYLNGIPLSFDPWKLANPDNNTYVQIDGVQVTLGIDPLVDNPD